jgi:hypothetical protein
MSFIGASSLLIDAAASFGTGQGTTSYTGPKLESFGANDTIDIKDFLAAGTSLNYDATSGLLQLTNGTKTADLSFQVSTLGGGLFHIASDAQAGILITRG